MSHVDLVLWNMSLGKPHPFTPTAHQKKVDLKPAGPTCRWAVCFGTPEITFQKPRRDTTCNTMASRHAIGL